MKLPYDPSHISKNIDNKNHLQNYKKTENLSFTTNLEDGAFCENQSLKSS